MSKSIINSEGVKYLNVSFYRFVKIDPSELTDLKIKLRQIAESKSLKGTILLAPEGFNGFLAGNENQIREFLIEFAQMLQLASPVLVKESYSTWIPYKRMLVKAKREIIAFGEGICPFPLGEDDAKRISPEELSSWYDENKDFVILDTRNLYETRLGRFQNAIDPKIKTFTEFKNVFHKLDLPKDKIIVTYCTGGIRCEKAAPWIRRVGYENVYQLDGGILRYFEIMGSKHWVGECFVFDFRVGLDPKLQPTGSKLCWNCQEPLTTEDMILPSYEYEKSCPYCYEHKVQEGSTQEAMVTEDQEIRA